MHIFYTNKVSRVVLQFLWAGTVASPGTTGPAGAAGLAGAAGPVGAAAPAPCHVLGPNQVLPHLHNLDERD
jgi:hypothetical protein